MVKIRDAITPNASQITPPIWLKWSIPRFRDARMNTSIGLDITFGTISSDGAARPAINDSLRGDAMTVLLVSACWPNYSSRK